MPSYEGPAFSFKQLAPTIGTAFFWSVGHYAFNTFKATGNHTVISLRIPGQRGSSAAGTLRVGIQTVTGAPMNSLPDGTWLAYEDISVSTYTTSMASKWVTLTVPYTLTKNVFYAIVAQAQSGTFSAGANEFVCGYNTVSYTAGVRFFPTTGRQAASSSVGIADYVLGYRTSSQAYYGVIMPMSDDVAANVEMGARFVVPSGQYSSIECLGVRNKSNASAQQTVRLYDASNNVIATATPKFDNSLGRMIYDIYWDTAVNLTAGQTYYWGTVCPSTVQYFSQISVDANTDWLADTSWQFAKARRTTPVTGAWTITTTENYEHQLILGDAFAAAPAYLPTERNAGVITIAPGSTSQSIELYLGITGLTTSSAGLSARYNRTRTASVSIPLVARTIAQAWTAGGFAEVDATNMPGVYRIDIPDAALAAGADDVTVVVRGASGTNGAVMTVKLSSGGLTEAQTATAVWGAQVAGYNTALDFGGVINETRNVVGATETYVQGVASDVWDELKVNHTIPNTFGDYLDTKVSTGADTARIQLRQGPFLIKQNAIDSVITEVNQFLSTVPNIEMVLIDSSGGSVSVAGATLVMRVRNQAGTAVVNNITPTVAYADGGVIRWSPNLSWNALTVTTPGTYRIVVERTMSGVTTTFGPFLVQLSSG